jgi:hypothetical protein
MSSISSRTEIRSVSSTVLAAAAVGGVILCAHLIKLMCSSLSAAGSRLAAQHLNSPVASDKVESVAELRQQFRSAESRARRRNAGAALSPVDSIRVSTLQALAATPYHVEGGLNLASGWRALQQASTPAQARQAQGSLLEAVESSHRRVFATALSMACRNAVVEIGFDRVETVSRPDGQIRVIATDAAGRRLVSEIDAQKQQDTIQTEVVGVADGSCMGILDAFDHALETQGVRSSAPKRTLTGGVCSLEAAKEFVRRKVRPSVSAASSAAPSASVEAARRAQRLNPRQTQTTRRERS